MLEKMKMIWQDAKQLKDERGLTLVELLVVVVILGIIAAIAVVAIGGIIENSKKDAMVADAKQMVSAAKLYTVSNSVEKTEALDFKTTDGKEFIASMNDPFNTDNEYGTAVVDITNTNGKYSYTVHLVGSKFQFEDNTSESSLKKDNLAKVTAK